jgi:hypothetical protein
MLSLSVTLSQTNSFPSTGIESIGTLAPNTSSLLLLQVSEPNSGYH